MYLIFDIVGSSVFFVSHSLLTHLRACLPYLNKHGHIDHQKSVLVEKGASFQLSHISKSGAIIVCEPPTGWNRDPTLAELSDPSAVKWRLSGVDISNPKSIKLTKACYHFEHLDPPKGNATLEVQALSDKAVRINHVIWY